MVLKNCKELVKLLNSMIVDLRTNFYSIKDDNLRIKLTKILNEYRDRLDELEINDD